MLDDIEIVDAHHHLWDLNALHYPSLTGPPHTGFFLGDNTPIRKNYLPEDYRRDSARHNVIKTVHVEAECSRDSQVAETEWITKINAEHGFPNAIVAHAWFDEANSEEIIAAQAAFPLVRGIRSKPATAPSPAGRFCLAGTMWSTQPPSTWTRLLPSAPISRT